MNVNIETGVAWSAVRDDVRTLLWAALALTPLTRLALVSGVPVTPATLVKAQTMLLGPVLLFILACRDWRWSSVPRAVARAFLETVVMVATVARWTDRNAVVMGAPIPVSTNGTMSLLATDMASISTGSGYN